MCFKTDNFMIFKVFYLLYINELLFCSDKHFILIIQILAQKNFEHKKKRFIGAYLFIFNQCSNDHPQSN
jgi:hypothetical protein